MAGNEAADKRRRSVIISQLLWGRFDTRSNCLRRCSSIALGLIFLALSCGRTWAACGESGLPQIDSRAQWYCAADSETLVVFVHGFNSSSRTAWLRPDPKNPDRYTYWPQLVVADEALELPPKSGKKPAVFLAGFYTGLDSTIFGLRDAADQLYTSLSQSFEGQPPAIDHKNILFVGHSAGGIVIRDMLVRHAKDFAGRRIGLLLVASPSKGSRYASDLAPPQAVAKNLFVEQLAVDSDYLTALDRDFRAAIAPDGPFADLRGKEIYEHRILDGEVDPDASWFARIRMTVAETLATTALQERVVERASAAVYFPDPVLIPQSNHSTIAHPKDVNHPSHLALREVFRQMLASRAKPCDPPSHLKVIFKMDAPDERTVPDYQLVQLDTSGDPVRTGVVARDPLSGFYAYSVTEGPFACPGEPFWAKLARVSATSKLTTAASDYTDACFRRSRLNPQATRALLDCQEGTRCEVDSSTPGIAEACMQPIKVRIPAAPPRQHWVVPSLGTLERQSDEVRSGYAEFTVESQRLSGVEQATELSFGVFSNGVPIHMDGLEHHLERTPFDPSGGVHLTFALENLGFTGGIDGYEQIEVELRFYAGKQPIKTTRLLLPYVSYRNAPLQGVTETGGSDSYEWAAYYLPAKVQASYEVVIEYGKLDFVKKRRALFNASGRSFNGQPAVGVIRPARKDNPISGFIVGLKLATGQIKSLFSKDEADDICRWVMGEGQFDELQQHGAYVFQFPRETFTRRIDKGKRVAWCREI